MGETVTFSDVQEINVDMMIKKYKNDFIILPFDTGLG